jgi:predicted molibdopterin-dependent oxidoreductase YjgC
MKPSLGCEVCLVAYNGKSQRQSKTEAEITGTVTKVTEKYIHIRSYKDGSIWKAPAWQLR